MSARSGSARYRRAAAAVLGVGALIAVVPAVGSATAGAAGPTAVVVAPGPGAALGAPVFTRSLDHLGRVNLRALAARRATARVAGVPQGSPLGAPAAGTRFRAVDNGLVTRAAPRGSRAVPAATARPLTTTNVAG